MIDELKPLLSKFLVFAKPRLKFKHPPRLFLKNDKKNSKCMLGRTAHYNPSEQSITLYVTKRHPKDIMRSFAHELVHHCQNERGDLAPEKMKTMSKNYAQENEHMRKMEEEAYLQGNMCFRDWEDNLEDKAKYVMYIAEQKYLKENNNMSVKITKQFLKETISKLLDKKTLSEQRRSYSVSELAYARNQVAKILGGTLYFQRETTQKIHKAIVDGARKGGYGAAYKAAKKEADKLLNSKVKPNARGEKFPTHRDVHIVALARLFMEEIRKSDNAKVYKDALASYAESLKSKDIADQDQQAPQDVKESENQDAEEPEEASGNARTSKHDNHPALKGDQDELPDSVQKGIIDAAGDEEPEKSKTTSESKIQTPEQENTLYENRFADRNTKLFEKLTKKWAK